MLSVTIIIRLNHAFILLALKFRGLLEKNYTKSIAVDFPAPFVDSISTVTVSNVQDVLVFVFCKETFQLPISCPYLEYIENTNLVYDPYKKLNTRFQCLYENWQHFWGNLVFMHYSNHSYAFILLVLKQDNYSRTRSIAFLLISRLLASTIYQQSRYWMWRIIFEYMENINSFYDP